MLIARFISLEYAKRALSDITLTFNSLAFQFHLYAITTTPTQAFVPAVTQVTNSLLMAIVIALYIIALSTLLMC